MNRSRSRMTTGVGMAFLLGIAALCQSCSTYFVRCDYTGGWCEDPIRLSYEPSIRQGCGCQAKDFQGRPYGPVHYGSVTSVREAE